MKILEIKVLRGPNYWSIRRPKLIQLKIDLEEMEELPTNKIPGFKERLEKILPSLYEHRCSEDAPGGFFSRVAEGTGQAVYMAATARPVAAGDVGRALEVYPGPADPGPPLTAEQVREPAPYLVYQATVRERWILCPRDAGKCARHGLASDHRVPVDLRPAPR